MQTFSELCSSVWDMKKLFIEELEEIANSHTAGEAGEIVMRHQKKMLRQHLQRYGYTPLTFFEEVAKRMGDRFAFMAFYFVVLSADDRQIEQAVMDRLALLSEQDYMNKL